MRHVVALTGSSGMPYGARLLQSLPGEKVLVVSDMGKRILPKETDITYAQLKAMADQVYEDTNLFAPIASGSHVHDGMIICPCSESTLGKIACGIADTLITRAAAVTLKEGRKLIIVPRETPLSQIMIENELRLSRAGAVILPASPGFYNRPRSVEEMVDFVVGRVLDQLRVEHQLYRRWE